VTQLAYPQLVTGSGGYHECIAISQTGAWFRYDFLFSNDTLNDYPKWGVWPDAYYMSNNDFLNAASFTGVTVTAFDRAQMLASRLPRCSSPSGRSTAACCRATPRAGRSGPAHRPGHPTPTSCPVTRPTAARAPATRSTSGTSTSTGPTRPTPRSATTARQVPR